MKFKLIIIFIILISNIIISQPLGLVVHKDLTDSVWRYFEWRSGITANRYEIILDKNNEKGYEYQDEIYFYFENSDNNFHFSLDTIRDDILQDIIHRVVIVPLKLSPDDRIKEI